MKRLAIAGAIVLATAACGTGDETHHQWVGSPDVPHRDSPSFHPADPTSGLADRLALLRAPRQRAGRGSRSRSVIVPARNSTPSGDGGTAVTSTAYCETGVTASGSHTFSGSVAMNGVPLGSRWRVVETGQVFVVADRIGHGSEFDIAMPGDCEGARRYGRRMIHVERVA